MAGSDECARKCQPRPLSGYKDPTTIKAKRRGAQGPFTDHVASSGVVRKGKGAKNKKPEPLRAYNKKSLKSQKKRPKKRRLGARATLFKRFSISTRAE